MAFSRKMCLGYLTVNSNVMQPTARGVRIIFQGKRAWQEPVGFLEVTAIASFWFVPKPGRRPSVDKGACK